MNSKRITRLVKLLQELLDGAGHNPDSLAQACQVSRRTVFRDLEALKEAGVPLKFDKHREKYSVPSGYFLPPTNFTAAEALALIALASEVGHKGQLPFYEASQSAAQKLVATLPAPLQDELELKSKAIRIRLPATGKFENHRGVYNQLLESRATGKMVRIDYQSLTEWERISTKLSPYHLMFHDHSWYVVGRSSLHKEVRTFKLNRIAGLEPLNESFSVPKTFRIERYLGNAWRIIPGPGADVRVHLRFRELVAQNVAEVNWHKTQAIKFHEDGTLDFEVQVTGIYEISWWILGYGDQVEVIAPKKLRKLVAQRAKNMVAMYGDIP